MTPRGYAICTTPRSGSNWLSQILASTGVLGRPLEYFNGAARRILDDASYPDDPGEQVQRILTAGATPNGVFALKLFPSQHDGVADKIRWTRMLPGLRFVHLARRDILRQAISWHRAEQTQQFRSTQAVRGPAEYDGPRILELLQSIVRENGRWQTYFARNGIEPLPLTYEDLLTEPQSAARAVAGLLQLDALPVVDFTKTDLVVQRDSHTEEWRRRFLRDFGNLDSVDA